MEAARAEKRKLQAPVQQQAQQLAQAQTFAAALAAPLGDSGGSPAALLRSFQSRKSP